MFTIFLSVIAIFICVCVTTVFFMLYKGIELSDEKIGADILIISSKSEFPKTEFLYTSLPSRRYISREDLAFLNEYEQIDKITYQFFTHTLSEGCCSTNEKTRVVGFDEKNDYLINPWIKEQKISVLEDDSIVVGTDITLKKGDRISLLGKVFTVEAKLNRTGTGLDHTIFMKIDMARALTKNKFNSSVFKGEDPQNLVTSVYIKVKPGTGIHSLVENINASQDKVMATSKAESIEHMKLQINAWTKVVMILTSAIIILALFSLYSRYDATVRSRTKEIGYMRAIGMSRFKVVFLSITEILILSLFSSTSAALLAIFVMPGLVKYLKASFSFPISEFNLGTVGFILLVSVLISVFLSLFSSIIPTIKTAKMQPKDAMNRGQL